jgi:hypothetical protein
MSGTSSETDTHGVRNLRHLRFIVWARQRPLVGSVLVALAGVEMFFSSQLDLGNIHVSVGVEGLQATIIPILLVLLGVLSTTMPVHRIFYGVIALVIAVYSLVGLNLGGFLVGMLLGSVGGILVVSWMPRAAEAHPIGSQEGRLLDEAGDVDAAHRDASSSEASRLEAADVDASNDSATESEDHLPLVHGRR